MYFVPKGQTSYLLTTVSRFGKHIQEEVAHLRQDEENALKDEKTTDNVMTILKNKSVADLKIELKPGEFTRQRRCK